jgi:hypothetical protein
VEDGKRDTNPSTFIKIKKIENRVGAETNKNSLFFFLSSSFFFFLLLSSSFFFFVLLCSSLFFFVLLFLFFFFLLSSFSEKMLGVDGGICNKIEG